MKYELLFLLIFVCAIAAVVLREFFVKRKHSKDKHYVKCDLFEKMKTDSKECERDNSPITNIPYDQFLTSGIDIIRNEGFSIELDINNAEVI